MIGLPSLHGFASILVAAAMFYGFASGRARVEIISLLTIGVIALGLYFFPLPGTAPQDGLALAFGGFGHHALITICALMILGRGLVVTGALDPAARALNRVWRFNRQLGLLVTLALALILSMVINDTPVLVLLLPIMAQLAHQGRLTATHHHHEPRRDPVRPQGRDVGGLYGDEHRQLRHPAVHRGGCVLGVAGASRRRTGIGRNS